MYSVPEPQSTVTVLGSLPWAQPCPTQTPTLSWTSPETHDLWAQAQSCWCPRAHQRSLTVPGALTHPLAFVWWPQPVSRGCDCHHPCPRRLGSLWTPALSCLGHPAPCWSDCSSAPHLSRGILFDRIWNSQEQKYHILGNTPLYRVQH